MRIYANRESLPSDECRADAYAKLNSVASHPESMSTERAFRVHEACERLRDVSGTRCAFVAYCVVDDDNVTPDNPRVIYEEREYRSNFVLRTNNPRYNVFGALTDGTTICNVVAMVDANGNTVWKQGPNTLQRKRYDPRKTIDTRHGGTYTANRKIAYTEPSPDGGDWTPIVSGYAYASDLFAANKHGKPGFEYETAEGTFRWHSLGDRLRFSIKPLDSKYGRRAKELGTVHASAFGVTGGSNKPFVANRCANALGKTRGFGSIVSAAVDAARTDGNETAVAVLCAMLRAGTADIIQPMRTDRQNSRCKALEPYLTADDLDRFTLLRMPAAMVQDIIRPYMEAVLLGA